MKTDPARYQAFLPFVLSVVAWSFPATWAIWGAFAIGTRNTVLGSRDFLFFTWAGSLYGVYITVLGILFAYFRTKRGVAVRYRKATLCLSAAYLMGVTALSVVVVAPLL